MNTTPLQFLFRSSSISSSKWINSTFPSRSYTSKGQKKFILSPRLKERNTDPHSDRSKKDIVEKHVENIVKSLDASRPLETKSLFTVSGYISNFFANFLNKRRKSQYNIEEKEEEEASFQNQNVNTYELLRTPMTDIILHEVVNKDRKHFIENVLADEIKRNTKHIDGNVVYNYVLSNNQKRQLGNLSSMELSQLLDKRTVEKRNRILNVFGFYEKDRVQLNKQAEDIMDQILEHVGKFAENNIYEKTNLPNPGEYWVESELNLLNLHIWLVFRRLSFCYDGKEMMHMLNRMYWKFVKVTLENDIGVPSAQVNKSLKKIQDHAYGMWFSLDEVLQIDSPVQDLVMAEVLMRFLYPIVEDIRMRDLHFWVRYVRYTQTYLDLVETPLFVRGAWTFAMPDSPMVLKVDTLPKDKI